MSTVLALDDYRVNQLKLEARNLKLKLKGHLRNLLELETHLRKLTASYYQEKILLIAEEGQQDKYDEIKSNLKTLIESIDPEKVAIKHIQDFHELSELKEKAIDLEFIPSFLDQPIVECKKLVEETQMVFERILETTEIVGVGICAPIEEPWGDLLK